MKPHDEKKKLWTEKSVLRILSKKIMKFELVYYWYTDVDVLNRNDVWEPRIYVNNYRKD